LVQPAAADIGGVLPVDIQIRVLLIEPEGEVPELIDELLLGGDRPFIAEDEIGDGSGLGRNVSGCAGSGEDRVVGREFRERARSAGLRPRG